MKLGMNELLVVLLIVVIVFGPTQIPKLTRMMGKGVKQFREGLNEGDDKTNDKTDNEAEKDAAHDAENSQ